MGDRTGVQLIIMKCDLPRFNKITNEDWNIGQYDDYGAYILMMYEDCDCGILEYEQLLINSGIPFSKYTGKGWEYDAYEMHGFFTLTGYRVNELVTSSEGYVEIAKVKEALANPEQLLQLIVDVEAEQAAPDWDEQLTLRRPIVSQPTHYQPVLKLAL